MGWVKACFDSEDTSSTMAHAQTHLAKSFQALSMSEHLLQAPGEGDCPRQQQRLPRGTPFPDTEQLAGPGKKGQSCFKQATQAG